MACRLKSLCLKILTIFLTLSGQGAASDYLQTIADSLASSGFYDDAITEYYRHMFFNRDSLSIDEIYSKIGFCYGNLEQWNNALEALDKSILNAPVDSLKETRRIDKAVILMASGDIKKARSELKTAAYGSSYGENSKRASSLLFLSAILDHDWSEALDLFRASDRSGITESDSMESVLIDAIDADYRSPKTAVLLSILIPGAGQVYCGGWHAGLNAFALDGSLGYLTVDNMIHRRYVTGALIFYFLFQRYYRGNLDHAYDIAVRENEKINTQFESEILNLIGNEDSIDVETSRLSPDSEVVR